jgi:aryl-alcohol dehydrogenase-like predicted oxidoreductase
MKIDPRISAELARLEPNQIGVLAWSLMAAGGIPGQPDPDTPEQPTEPGVPTLPDEPPPAPVA